MDIRLIEDFDQELLDKLVELETRTFRECGLSKWELVPLIQHGKLLVLFDEQDPVGFLELMDDWDDEDTAYLYALAIEEDYRNQGLGTKLIKSGMELLIAENYSKASLTVAPDNEPAIHVYKDKLGFENIAHKKNVYGDGIDRYYMELDLVEYNKNKNDELMKIAS
ncbi:MAG: GNAT family N-acetyltransferase [Halanaerobium sp.]